MEQILANLENFSAVSQIRGYGRSKGKEVGPHNDGF